MRQLHWFIGFLLVCLVACKKEDLNSMTLSGTVVDEAGLAVAGAAITSGNAMATTDADGTFVLNDIDASAQSFRLTATKNGYFPAYSNVENIDGSSMNSKLVLLAKSLIGTIPAAGGQVATTGMRVTAPAGAFRNADGTTYAGAVAVNAKYVGATNANIARAMPGGDFLATNAAGADGGMRTYGFTATEFLDAAGKALTPTATVKIGVTLPTGTAAPAATGAKAWAYDPATGKWSGDAAVTTSGAEVFMPCITLYQNLDTFIQFGMLEGTVRCADGSPVAGAEVTITNPFNKYVTVTNANGRYRAKVEATTVASYTVAAGGQSVSIAAPTRGATVTAGVITTSSCATGGGGAGATTGSFTINGQAFSGICSAVPATTSGCSGIDVVIATASGNGFAFYNMPQQSSGNYTLTDAYQNISTCNLFSLTTLLAGTQYGSSTGTVTKTGAKSFTFSCTVKDLTTNQTYPASGSGSW